MKDLIKLFTAFFKVGILTFGGGLAMLPMLNREIVEKNHWTTTEELFDYFAIGQCTPGVIAVNTATFIGYKQKGLLGGLIATAGIICPSLIIIISISGLLSRYSSYEAFDQAFSAIRVAVSALTVDAVIKMGKTSIKNKFAFMLFGVAFIIMAVFNPSPIYIVSASIFLGLILNTKKKVSKNV